MSDYHADRAKEILRTIDYVTIATSSPEDGPWNTPVFAAFDDDGNIYWTSSPAAQHSRNIERDERVFIVVFDSTAKAGEGEGVYLRAIARRLASEGDVQAARTALDTSAGNGALESDAYYVAVPQQAWMNDIETDDDGNYVRDCRIEIDHGRLFRRS